MKACKFILTLLSIAVAAAVLYCTNEITAASAAIALLLYLLSSSIHLLAHECGHWIGGAASGYTLLCLQLGPLRIAADQTRKLRLGWSGSLSGQCIMVPKRTEEVRYVAYNLGGIVANGIVIALAMVLLLADWAWAVLFLAELICVGLQKIIVNAVPHKTGGVPNDGYILKLLGRSKAVQKDYAVYLRLYGKLFWEEDIAPQEFMYQRETPEREDELLYYREIQDILGSLPPEQG